MIRWKHPLSSLLSVLVCLVLATAVVAQEADDEESPVPGLRVDPDLLEQEGGEPGLGPDDDLRAQRMRRVNLEILSRYPGDAAMTLLEELIARGKKSVPFLLSCLEESSVKVRLAAVYALGEIREPESFDLLRAAAAERRNSSRLAAFADALVAIDRDRGLKEVAGYLAARRPIVRRHARDSLLTHLTKADAAKVLTPYLESEEGEARQLTLEILSRLLPEESLDTFLAHLRDEFPGAAYVAAEALARHARERELAQLRQLVLDGTYRSGAYATIALVMAEDIRGDRLFDVEVARKVLDAFRSADQLDQGAAAIAMSNLSTWMEDTEFVQLLDRRVVPVLIDTAGSTKYFADQLVLRELVLRKLVALTGKNLSFDWIAWRKWWLGERHSFEALRGLKSPASIEPDRATLRWLATDRRGEPVDVLFATFWLEDMPGESIRLTRDDMGTLLDSLSYEGFFDLPETIGEQESSIRRSTVVLQGEGRTKAVTLVGSPDGAKAEIFTRIANLLAEERNRHRWQRYHDEIAYPDRFAWWLDTYEWWKSGPTQEQMAWRLRTMILSSFDQLSGTVREDAFHDLAVANEQTDRPVSESEAFYIVGPLGDGDLSMPQARLLCGILAEAKHAEVLGPALASVVQVAAYDSQELARILLAGYGRAAAVRFISHPEALVRASACEAVGTSGPADDRAYELLSLRLEDDNESVQAAAAYAIGLLGDERGLALLKERFPKAGRYVQKEIVGAIGRIGGPRAVELLIPLVDAPDRLVRQGALAALGASADESAVYPLLAALRLETSPVGRAIVADALARFPGAAARDSVLQRLEEERNPGARLALLDTLSQMEPASDAESDPAVLALRRLAREAEGDEREASILALGKLGDRDSVPLLVSLLEQGENPRAAAALRRLTYQDFGSASARALADSYREWWQQNKSKSWKWWFLDALARAGYSPIKLFAALSTGEESIEAVPTLIEALLDERPEIRGGAARLLTDITGQDFGTPERASDSLSLAVLAAKWRQWYEQTK